MSLARLCAALGILSQLVLADIGTGQEVQPKKAVKLDQAGDALPPGAVARLGTTRFRHLGIVTFAGYSSDGNLLITGSGENSLTFWDVRTGQKVRTLESKVNTRRFYYGSMIDVPVLLSGDGKTLLLGADDGDCTVMDVATGRTLREFKLTGDMQRNRFNGDGETPSQLSYDGQLLVVVDSQRWRDNNKVTVWDTTTGKQARQFVPKEKSDIYLTAAMSRDGKTLVTIESTNPERNRPGGVPPMGDNTIKANFRFWDMTTGTESRAMTCPNTNVMEMRLSADGKQIFIRDRNNGSVRLLDAGTGKEIRQFAAREGNIRATLLSPDNTLFIAGNKQIQQFDVNSGKELREFANAPFQDDMNDFRFRDFGRSLMPLAVTPDGKTLVIGEQTTLKFYDVGTGKEKVASEGHRNRIDSVAFGPGGKQILTSSADGKVFLWDAATSKIARELAPKATDRNQKFNRRFGGERFELFRVRAAFAPDGKTIAGQWWGDKLHLWDAATGELKHHFGFAGGHSSFCFTPDGNLIAVASLDGGLALWNPATGKQVRTFVAGLDPENNDRENMGFDGFDSGAYSTCFSADGRTLMVGGVQLLPNGLMTSVSHWEMASGQERVHSRTVVNFAGPNGLALDGLATALDSAIVGFAFAPDGKTSAELGFNNVKLRNPRTGQEIRGFGGRELQAASTLYSPDGSMLVVGKHDGALRLWDVANGTVLFDFPAHQAHVLALAFSADGKWLVSGCKDSSVLIWDWDYIRQQAAKGRPEPSLPEPDLLWKELASKDATKALLAIQALGSSPDQAVALFKSRLHPVAPVDRKLLEKLVEDLDDVSYETRKNAQLALEKLGDLAADVIKDQLAGSPPIEVSLRLKELQVKLSRGLPSPETLQAVRAIEVLESIATLEARAVLQTMADGSPGHRATLEARSSLRRLGKK